MTTIAKFPLVPVQRWPLPPIYASASRALSPLAEYVITTAVDAAALLAGGTLLDKLGALGTPTPPPVTPQPDAPTVGGEPPGALPPQTPPMWTADP